MATNDRLDELLARVEIFSSLDEHSLGHVKELLSPVRLSPGEILCAEGDGGDRMFILGAGELRVLKRGQRGAQVEIARLVRGEVAGMMSLFGQEPRSATLQAAGAAEVWEIGHEAFDRLLEAEPTVAHGLIVALSRYLRQETRMVAELRSRDADNRLKVAVVAGTPAILVISARRCASYWWPWTTLDAVQP
jgi:CRP-like cAMP-binding protein